MGIKTSSKSLDIGIPTLRYIEIGFPNPMSGFINATKVEVSVGLQLSLLLFYV